MAFPACDIPDLPEQLRQLLAQVPAGWVTTPGAMAAALGNPVAARWIGHFLLHHDHDDACPCHRVVRAGGHLGAYAAGDAEAKLLRLRAEGIEIDGDTIDLDRYGFTSLVSGRPLEKLSQLQETIVSMVEFRVWSQMPSLVGGVDVSYAGPGEGVAAYTLVESATGKLVWTTTVRRPVRFPYISSYLSFRELPLLTDLLDEVRAAKQLAPVVLIDGTGILHPRHAGIATHLGVVQSLPTIGITKKLLCGRVDVDGLRPLESRRVIHDDREVGIALRPTAGSRRPIFISPGHGVDLAFAEQVVRRMLTGRRLPEPLYWADRLSRQHAKNV